MNGARRGTILIDDLVGVEEHDVDREPHERRVDRPGRAEEDAVPGRQVALAEQAAKTPHRRVRDDHGLGDDAAVFAAERQVRDGAHEAPLAARP